MQCVQFRFVTPIAESIIAGERGRGGEGEEEGGGKDRFWEIDIPPCIPLYPAQIQPASLPHPHPSRYVYPARIIMYVVRGICCSSLSSLVRLSLRRHPHSIVRPYTALILIHLCLTPRFLKLRHRVESNGWYVV